jgi:hypothetical protein
MRRILVSVLVTGVALLATATESRGDAAASLTPAQATAKSEFLDDLKETLDHFKDACGAPLTLTTDFENYDASAPAPAGKEGGGGGSSYGKKGAKGGDDEKRGASPSMARRLRVQVCRDVIDAVADDCGNARKPNKVKAVACLFAGHKPRDANDDMDDFVVKNMSFTPATGLLTVRQATGPWPNMEENVRAAINPESPWRRFNGAKCEKSSDCKSFDCAAGTCSACSAKVPCPTGSTCGSKGRCYTKEAPRTSSDDDEPSSSGSSSSSSRGASKPAKAAKKGSGAICKSMSDCESNKCQLVKSDMKWHCK